MNAPTVRRQRRPLMMVAAAGLIVAGALLSAWLYLSVGNAREVLVARQAVARGATITAADLAVVRVSVDPLMQTVAGDSLGSVVGKRASLDIPAGSLVAPSSVADDAMVMPERGRSVVGLALGPGLMPGEPLLVGDRVRVILVDAKETPVPAVDGVVVGVTGIEQSQAIVSVQVDETAAPVVAAAAAAGKAAVTLETRER